MRLVRGGAEAEVAVVSELHHLVHPVVPVFRSPQSNSLLDCKLLQRCDGALDGRGAASRIHPGRHLPPVLVAEDGREEPLDPWRGPVDPGAQWIANVEVALAGVQESPGAGDLVARRGGRDAPRTLQRGHRVGDGALVRGCRGRAAGLGDGLEAREEKRLGVRRRRGCV